MIDPWNALSLAASIAQFVDFGGKVISLVKEVKEEGSSLATLRLKRLTVDLASVNQAISEHALSKTVTGVLTDDEQALDDLATECAQEAQTLLVILNKLALQSDRKKWQSFSIALRRVWKQDDINTLERRLSAYREQLALRILGTLNAKNDALATRLGGLEQSSREIVEVVSINHQSLNSTIQRKQHDVIFKLNDMEPTGNFPDDPRSYAGSANQSSITYGKTPGEEGEFDEADRAYGFKQTDFSAVSRTVLAALYFRVLTDREDQVIEAHENTFQWIYRDPAEKERPWSNFVEWLQSGCGCYWVNGKAGSGKSTLLKYVFSEQRTHDALAVWAADHHLLTASFFFWNAGTTLQKSQQGLLRSLMFQILEQKPELLAVLFPGLGRALISQPNQNLEISFAELKKAFQVLIKERPAETKICLFIDGLDEYEGDAFEISEISELFLSTATSSDAVKVLVSSRPIPACVHVFSPCAQLRLQDLTSSDMVQYVEDKLANHALMLKMEQRENGTTAQLVDGITSKASGVFLWVMLVVRSLLTRLQNFDRQADLLRELDRLPADLEALYKHMLGSMSMQYQREASLIIQLIMRSVEIQESSMTLLQLSYAEEEAPLLAVKAPIEDLTEVEAALRYEATEGRMRSRCCGLVETLEQIKAAGHEPLVVFLHRTVIDFLREEKIWSSLTKLTHDSNLDLDELLLSSCLYEMKRRLPGPTTQESRLKTNLHHCFEYSELLETRTGDSHAVFLDEAYRVMQYMRKSLLRDMCKAPLWNNGRGERKIQETQLESSDVTALLIQGPVFAANLNFPTRNSAEKKLVAGIKVLLQLTANPNASVVLSTPGRLVEVLRSHDVSCGPDGKLVPWKLWLTSTAYLNSDARDVGVPSSMIEMFGHLLEELIRGQASLKVEVDETDLKKQSALSVIDDFVHIAKNRLLPESDLVDRIQTLVAEKQPQICKQPEVKITGDDDDTHVQPSVKPSVEPSQKSKKLFGSKRRANDPQKNGFSRLLAMLKG